MVAVPSLWLPILLSGVLVFVVSSIIHMVLSYHAGDSQPVPDEAKVMDALRPFEIPPGDYAMPRPASMKEMGEPAFIEKTKAGPVAFMTVLPNGPTAIGTSLARWFGYSLRARSARSRATPPEPAFTFPMFDGRAATAGLRAAGSQSGPRPPRAVARALLKRLAPGSTTARDGHRRLVGRRDPENRDQPVAQGACTSVLPHPVHVLSAERIDRGLESRCDFNSPIHRAHGDRSRST